MRFAETIFGLEPLTEREPAASDMLDCFDLEQPTLPLLQLVSREYF